MAYNNSSDINVTGIVTLSSTGASTGSTVTQYGTVVASTNNTVSSVAPSATSGVPLISQGSSANPTYGTCLIAGGGTSVTSVTTAPAATAFAGWDANKNLSANSFIEGYRTTATAAATTTLVVGDAENQYFTGSTTQTVVMPVTSTLVLGQSYTIVNNSSGVVTVQSSGANTIQAMATLTQLVLTVVNTGVTTAAGWNTTYQTLALASSGITTLAGNSGTATGSTVTVTSGASANSGKTVTFTGSGSTVTLNVTDGSNNTTIGNGSGSAGLGSSTDNTYVGANTVNGSVMNGNGNVAVGSYAMYESQTNTGCVCIGYQAGYYYGSSSGTNYDVCIGYNAGHTGRSGDSDNIYINSAGAHPESNALRLGAATGTGDQQLNSAFICGIQTIVVTGTAVLVSSSDQLGVAASSKQFKQDIQDMGDTSIIQKLRPVTFVWDKDSSPGLKDAPDERQYGLIAEEVHETFPYLCSYDKDGKPFSVKYNELPALLLNELQKALKRIEILEEKLSK